MVRSCKHVKRVWCTFAPWPTNPGFRQSHAWVLDARPGLARYPSACLTPAHLHTCSHLSHFSYTFTLLTGMTSKTSRMCSARARPCRLWWEKARARQQVKRCTSCIWCRSTALRACAGHCLPRHCSGRCACELNRALITNVLSAAGPTWGQGSGCIRY